MDVSTDGDLVLYPITMQKQLELLGALMSLAGGQQTSLQVHPVSLLFTQLLLPSCILQIEFFGLASPVAESTQALACAHLRRTCIKASVLGCRGGLRGALWLRNARHFCQGADVSSDKLVWAISRTPWQLSAPVCLAQHRAPCQQPSATASFCRLIEWTLLPTVLSWLRQMRTFIACHRQVIAALSKQRPAAPSDQQLGSAPDAYSDAHVGLIAQFSKRVMDYALYKHPGGRCWLITLGVHWRLL